LEYNMLRYFIFVLFLCGCTCQTPVPTQHGCCGNPKEVAKGCVLPNCKSDECECVPGECVCIGKKAPCAKGCPCK
jgi:hypothetical protein